MSSRTAEDWVEFIERLIRSPIENHGRDKVRKWLGLECEKSGAVNP